MSKSCVLSGMNSEFETKYSIILAMTDESRLVIPRDKRTEILSMLHDCKMAGHPGMSGMKLTICSRFY